MSTRDYTAVDTLLMNIDQALRTVFGHAQTTGRSRPVEGMRQGDLKPAERQRSARLMRVNHTGEICAQALYQGQALTARLDAVRDSMEKAAMEENDHLSWCEARLTELGYRTSVLNPLFYTGSFIIGAVAGKIGDSWSLGFVAETERQVVQHLDHHLQQLPAHDHKSRAILETMKEDENHHATTALEAGGAMLPLPARLLMQAASKLMTRTAYWI